ncbi:MAG: peptide-methionine (S)-S-oxide reductase MsrA [Rhodobacter sp.]|nr:peptide-methionine (S)-S-oxide reductase MsrA [Rhodobacter sp.]MBK8438802.1 peptide-methionine (S)-S-oxide reductase MsrA [Rhodobacter sp.]
MKLVLAVALALAAMTGIALAKTEKAIVAGGCFWCVEADFESVKGVKSVVSGYAGGKGANPTYDDHQGHIEAVEITFDTAVITYDQLIRMFLRSVDVTDAGGQFCDRGSAYVSAIFVSTPAQKASAKAAIAEAQAALGKKVVTRVKAASTFWKAEEVHQDFYKGSQIILTRAGPKSKKSAYRFYRNACGRDARVKALWGAEAAFAK